MTNKYDIHALRERQRYPGAVDPKLGIWLPTALATPTVWIDFADKTKIFTNTGLSTPVVNSFDYVMGVADKSGNGNNLTQSNSSLAPQWIESIKNNRSGMFFDSSRYLQFAARVCPLSDFTLFMVACYHIGTVGDRRPVGFENSSSGTHGMGLYSDGKWWIIRDNGSNYDINMSITPSKGTWYLWELRIDPASQSQAWVNGSSGGTSAATTFSDASITGNIGSSGSDAVIFHGYMGEFLIYPALTDANRQIVEKYLNHKWAIY